MHGRFPQKAFIMKVTKGEEIWTTDKTHEKVEIYG